MSDILPVFAQIDPIGHVFGQVLLLAIVSLIGGFFLQLATKWVCDLNLVYETAVLYVLTVGLVVNIINTVFGLAVLPLIDPKQPNTTLGIAVVAGSLSAVVSLIVAAIMYGTLIKTSRGQPVGFGKGCLITLILFTISAILVVAFVAIVVAITIGTKAASANPF